MENKFLQDDLESAKKRTLAAEQKYEKLHGQVLSVNHYSRIYHSQTTKVTAIETAELANLKTYIEELERKVRELLRAAQQEKVTLGVRRDNLGEEIVRLKKNIDLQLGLPVDETNTRAFLDVYKDTNACFDHLIQQCRK